MFYSKFMFVKKGPLFKLWVAAHNGKKLSKNDVSRVKVADSVDTIVNPSAPLALRLSSTLLLGLVRIYQRQVRYLQEDCSDALTKMKLVFRPGQIDLPANGGKAPAHSITLSASAGGGYLELELDGADLAALDLDDDAELLLEGGLLEGPDDLTIEVARGEGAAGAAAGAGDAVRLSLGFGGDDDLLAVRQDGPGGACDMPLDDDDGLLPLDDDDLMPSPAPEREVARGEAAVAPASAARAALGGDLDLLGDMGSAAGKELEFPADDDDMMPMVDDDDLVPLAGDDDDLPPPPHEAPEQPQQQEQQQQQDEEDDVAAVEEEEEAHQPRPRVRRPRKRKLERPDAVIELSRKQISAQLKDTRSIVLARRPVRAMAKRRRLTEAEREAGASAFDAFVPADDESYGTSLSARVPAGMAQMIRTLMEMRPAASAAPAAGDEAGAAAPAAAAAAAAAAAVDAAVDEADEAPLPALDDDEGPLPALDDDDLPPMLDDDDAPMPMFDDDDLPPMPEDDELAPEEDAEGEVRADEAFFGEDGDAAAAAAEAAGGDENAREDAGGFSRRTKKMHQVLSRELSSSGGAPLSFEELVRGRPAKTVAGVFYEILVLKKHDYVQVEQAAAFGDITVSKAAAFDRPFPGEAARA